MPVAYALTDTKREVSHFQLSGIPAVIGQSNFYQDLCTNRIVAGVCEDGSPTAGTGDRIWPVTSDAFTATGLESFIFYRRDF